VKKSVIIVRAIIISLYLISLTLFLECNSNNRKAQQLNFKKQLGTYVLDVKRTNLGSYKKDSVRYKKLQITFADDSTFVMNMKAPFLYDSIGRWIAGGGGLEDWNRLFYKSWHYSDYDKNSGNQFTQPWTKDSIFYINGATPQSGEEFIQEIYFRKLQSK
jgi:hypothetical protein